SRPILTGLLTLALTGTALVSGCSRESTDTPKEEVKVAGASSLITVMDELGPRFEAKTGTKVGFVAGSSGKLSAQIQQGAPFDVFLSADLARVDEVVKAGACDGATQKSYAQGRVAMWSRTGATPPPPTLAGLADPKFARIAIAQPEHAPY